MVVAFEEPIIEAQKSLNRLGGTIKIVEIFNEKLLSPAQIAETAATFLKDKFLGNTTKFSYALSLYGFRHKPEQILRKSLHKIKTELAAQKLKSRFINKNFHNPQNAAINGEKLLSKGAEIVAMQGSSKIFIGHTIALQDFENYSRRDFNRPERDPHLGMLPPKLCQIMINLCGFSKINTNTTTTTTKNSHDINKSTKIVYDPFCGIGTVLAEARLMGYSAIGSDIAPNIIAKCATNMNWLEKSHPQLSAPIRLFTRDAASLNKNDLPSPPDLIVTESYLGPPVSRVPQPSEMRKTFTNVKKIVSGFFTAIHPLIRQNTPVTICIPFYRDKHKFHFISEIAETITARGFDIEDPIPWEICAKFGLRNTPRSSLLYDRPDQIVGREIFIFRKK
jgi:tRNA G10  N-methylase Trm11